MEDSKTTIPLFTMELQEIQKMKQFFVFRDCEYHLEFRIFTELKRVITFLD